MATPLVAKDRALIVGINDYIHPGVNDLGGARGDAERFYDFVTKEMGIAPEDVITLFDRDATLDAVRGAVLDHLILGTQPGDQVVFYYAGHGTRVADRNGDEDDGFDEALVLSDAVGPDKGLLLDDEIEQILAALEDRETLLIFDSCHSGTINRQASAPGPDAPRSRYTELPGSSVMSRAVLDLGTLATSNAEPPLDDGVDNRVIWTAASASQLAWELPGEGGIFTTHFLKGVREGVADRNGNGHLTNAELLNYIRGETERWCAQHSNCTAGFTPSMTGPRDALVRFWPIFGLTGAGTTTTKIQPTPDTAPQNPTPVKMDVTDAFVSENQAGLRLWMETGADLRLGQTVEIRASAQAAGYLLLFDIDPLGNLYQLFPSPLSQRGINRIAPGETVKIPEVLSANGRPLQIAVTEPIGQGQMLALLIEDDTTALADFTVLPRDKAPGPIENAPDFLLDLALSLQGTLASATGNRTVQWSATALDYTIRR